MQEGYERTVREHQNRIYTYAYYFLGNREEAEDVTQDVLLRLWRHWTTLDGETVPRWLTTVTRNAALDVVRRRGRTVSRFASEGEAELERAAGAGSDGPDEAAAAADFRRCLERALQRLDDPYRSVVVLREIQQMSYQEISAVLGQPLNTVKSHLHRGRKMLREHLREVYPHVTA